MDSNAHHPAPLRRFVTLAPSINVMTYLLTYLKLYYLVSIVFTPLTRTRQDKTVGASVRQNSDFELRRYGGGLVASEIFSELA